MNLDNLVIVFYDGDCGFCNRSVQFILKKRKHDRFLFIALQSDKAKELLTPFDIAISMETIYLLQNNQVYQKSQAVLKLSDSLKRPYGWLKLGYILPRFIRDAIYMLVSRNRHKINAGFCALPTEAEKKLFYP